MTVPWLAFRMTCKMDKIYEINGKVTSTKTGVKLLIFVNLDKLYYHNLVPIVFLRRRKEWAGKEPGISLSRDFQTPRKVGFNKIAFY